MDAAGSLIKCNAMRPCLAVSFFSIFTGFGMTNDGKSTPAATGVPCPYTH